LGEVGREEAPVLRMPAAVQSHITGAPRVKAKPIGQHGWAGPQVAESYNFLYIQTGCSADSGRGLPATLQHFLLHYGYAFLVLGLIVEGDATLVAAVILAEQNYFSLRWVVGLGIVVSALLYEALYELGGRGRKLGWLPPDHQARASRWLHGRSALSVIFFGRFMWGFRLVIPFASGILHFRRRRFVWANFLGAAFWTFCLVFFGVALEAAIWKLLRDLHHYQSAVAVAIFLAGMAFALGSIPLQITLRRRRKQPEPVLSLELTETKKG